MNKQINIFETIKTYSEFYTHKVSPEKSKSSYGRWSIKVSNSSFKFYWKKKEALEFCNRFNGRKIN